MARNTPGFEAEVHTMDTRNMNSLITIDLGDRVVHGQVQGIEQLEDAGQTIIHLTDGSDYTFDYDKKVHLSAPMPYAHLYSILQVLNREFGRA